jgi:hypothetical protein
LPGAEPNRLSNPSNPRHSNPAPATQAPPPEPRARPLPGPTGALAAQLGQGSLQAERLPRLESRPPHGGAARPATGLGAAPAAAAGRRSRRCSGARSPATPGTRDRGAAVQRSPAAGRLRAGEVTPRAERAGSIRGGWPRRERRLRETSGAVGEGRNRPIHPSPHGLHP